MTNEEENWGREIASLQPAPLALVDRGVRYFQRNRLREALECFEEALVLAPDVTRLLILAAEASCHVRQPDGAVKHARHAVELNPNIADAWIALSWAYLQKGNFGDALCHAERAIELDRDKCFAWNNAGTALMYLGRFADARRRLDFALLIDPKNVETIRNRDACLRRLEKPDYTCFGIDFELVECALEAGQRVSVVIALDNGALDWRRLIRLTETYPRLLVVDTIERSRIETRKVISVLLELGATRMALDLMIVDSTREDKP
jgi:tetratricopeptide (TPR) repeat protein